jgi:tetratricopeptide (TPR) repeat protein
MKCARTSTVLTVLALVTPVAHKPAHAQAPQPVATAAAGRLVLTTNSPEARAEFWQGLEDWQSYSYSNAQKHFRHAYALDNGFALARVFATGNSVVPATVAERESAVADAARQSTEEGLLALFWREKALGHAAKERAILRAAIQLMPNEPGPAVEYLWSSLADGVDAKQLADSARALRVRFPNYAPTVLPLSVLAMNAGDTAGALRAAEEYTRVAPRTAASFGYYGSLLQQLGRYDQAEVQYRKGMSLLPHADYGADAASALAEMFVLHGRNADARAVATEALAGATEPSDSARYLAEIASTYFATGDARRAIQLLEQARAKSETVGSGMNPVPVDYILAEVSAMSGDLSSTRTYLGRMRPQTASDSAIMLANYASDYAYAGQLDSAIAYSDRLAIVHGVPWAEGIAHHTRGLAFAQVKQCGRARTEFAQAMDSTSLEVQTTRADCEFQLGNRAGGLALRDRALASQDFVLFDPSYVRHRLRLAQMK